jgi:hypothetical protein
MNILTKYKEPDFWPCTVTSFAIAGLCLEWINIKGVEVWKITKT